MERRTVTSLQALLKSYPDKADDAPLPAMQGGRRGPTRRVSAMDAFSPAPTPSPPPNARAGPSKRPLARSRKESSGSALLDEAVDRVLAQAGTVTSPRARQPIPLLVLTPCNLPAKQPEVTIDRLIERMTPYTQSEYALVLFASPSPSVSTTFLVSRYLRLPYAMRKNVQAFYICHASFITKMALRVSSGIVSPKTFLKIRTCATLSALAEHVDVARLDIPVAVLEHNLKLEPSIRLSSSSADEKQFGVPLERLMGEDGRLPRVVQDCIARLSQPQCLAEEGLFRVSPSSSHLRLVRELYDMGAAVRLEQYDPHVAASLLKAFFRSLPLPIFPPGLYTTVEACSTPEELRRIPLTYSKTRLFASLISLLHLVSLHDNKMDAHNLSICITPTLVRSDDIVRDGKVCTALRPLIKGLIDSEVESTPSTPALTSESAESLSSPSSKGTIKLMLGHSERTALSPRSSPELAAGKLFA